MLGKANFVLLYNVERGLGYSRRDTFAVILYVSKDAEGQPNFEATMADYNNNYTPPLTLADIQNIGNLSSNTTTYAQGNKNFGGSTCR